MTTIASELLSLSSIVQAFLVAKGRVAFVSNVECHY